LDAKVDSATIANYRDPTFVLGNVWTPKLSPIILTQPASAAVMGASKLTLTVACAAVPDATYQWRKNGVDIAGATTANFTITSATLGDAGAYSVVATNSAGSATSDTATITVALGGADIFAPSISKPPALPSIPTATVNVADLGAKGDGITDNTAAVQRAIRSASAAGGGIVEFPPSTQPYRCGPITLESKIDLQVDRGATLTMLPYAKDGPTPAYPSSGGRYADFISAANVHDLAITGGGTIDGQGAAWWAAFRANAAMPHRPFLVRMSNCSNVLVSGVTLTDSPMFHLAASAVDNFTVTGITIKAPANAPNTDGIDPSGQHQLIQSCNISVGDDNIAVKPGSSPCSDLLIADCTFGAGHGVSVGGQTNRGLDGLTVRNCTFNGTTTGLRLKADATQGGPVKNLHFEKLTMTNVQYPIAFYSYYKNVGSPGAVAGANATTIDKVNLWNSQPPNPLTGRTLPSWKDITIDDLTAIGSTGHSILWGLPTPDGLIAHVTLHNVHITGGPGFEIYDAVNVQLTGNTDIGKPITCNSLVITSQPADASIASGGAVNFTVTALDGSGTAPGKITYQWTFNGKPLIDGKNPDGSVVSGSTSASLNLTNAQSGEAGSYAAIVSTALDTYNTSTNRLDPAKLPCSATSSPAMLRIR
jgi:polygalacturonase